VRRTLSAAVAGGGIMAGTLVPGAGPARPVVIAHRGASGERPEHTLEAYRLAIEQGADFVEPDLVSTRDGVLVCRHENEISGTTDVARRAEFAARRTTKTIDGAPVTGWFAEDFTLAEMKTLRARERLPELRGTAHDGRFEVPTLEEVLVLVESVNAGRRERPVGVYPETKHPTYFESLGLGLEEPLLARLRAHGLDRADAPVFVQSFEVANLRRLAGTARVPLVQLIDASGRPWDLALGHSARTYADMLRPEGLRDVATYARAIGVHKSLVSASLVRDAHAAGLLVHVWTLRAENSFLPAALWRGLDPRGRGDMAAEATGFLDMGVDGYFTDHPALGVAARDAFRR
jgi:glycerophosphoryl diester phosphodiesterase